MLTNADFCAADHMSPGAGFMAIDLNTDLKPLMADSNILTFTNHQRIYQPGDPATDVYVVLDGCVQIYRHTGDGRRAVVTIIGKGDAFSISSVLDDGVQKDTAEVVRHCRIMAIPSQIFMNWLQKTPEMAISVARYLSRSKREITDQLEQIQLKPTTTRLAEFLLRLAPENVKSTDVMLPCEKSVIASYLGMKPESLSRSLKELKSYGVSNRGRRVHINDRDLLSSLGNLVAG